MVVVAIAAVVAIVAIIHPLPSPPRRGEGDSSSAPVRPTPLAEEFSAPDAVPAIVFHDAVDRGQYDAVQWDGSGLGRLGALRFAEFALANPAGTLFIAPESVVDRRGQPVAPFKRTSKGLPFWADDGRTLCRVTPELGPSSGVPASFEVATVGGAWRRVGQYGVVTELSGVGIAACSPLTDRAVLVGERYQGPNVHMLWVVQLSTGQVLWSRSYAGPNLVVDVRVSHDGTAVAEGRSTCCPRTPTSTTVYGPTGALVGKFEGHAGGYAGIAFSWDGSRLVLASGLDEDRVTVVDVRTGAIVWTAPAGLKVAGVYVEPSPGGRLGIALNDYGAFAGSDGYPPAADLYLVDANGVAKRLATQVRP